MEAGFQRLQLAEGKMSVEEFNKLDQREFFNRFVSSNFPPTPFQHPVSNAHYYISFESSRSMSNYDLQACFELVAATSQKDYEGSSKGWNPRSKLSEMGLPDLRYLLVRPSPVGKPEGFISFMVTYEDGHEVSYVYEIHLASTLRGTGLGKRLMVLVEDITWNCRLEKVMLTVFVSNKAGMSFYENMGYVEDEYSPQPRTLRNGRVVTPDYKILSKPV
jgi:ribosomal protein S18 acetylase RimI-like enzyme